MNITLVYTLVTKTMPIASVAQDDYDVAAKRFAKSLAEHPGTNNHRLMIVACGDAPSTEHIQLFDPFSPDWLAYDGRGKDCGAYIAASHAVKTDWCIMMAAHTYWTSDIALDQFLWAMDKYGDCLYGPSASYEVMSHIRTSCIGLRAEHLRRYPHKITEPADANRFECGDICFTNWMEEQGKMPLMVTHRDVYVRQFWRSPANIFRKGDQCDLLFFDRHTDIFEKASPEERAKLTAAADGK